MNKIKIMKLESEHTTLEGRTMLVSQMSTTHLMSTASVFFRNLDSLREALDEKKTDMGVLSFLDNRPSADPKKVQRLYTSTLDKIGDYLFELLVREVDIEPYRVKLREAIGRQDALAKTPLQLFVPEEDNIDPNEQIELMYNSVIQNAERDNRRFCREQLED